MTSWRDSAVRGEPVPTLERTDWPLCLHRGPEGALVGVYVGGCVAKGDGSRFRRKAHAHTEGPHRGWICILSAKRLADTMLMLHELAHIVSGEGHEDGFRTVLLQLGGTLDATGSMGECHKRLKAYRDPYRQHLGRQHHPACPCQLPVRSPNERSTRGVWPA